MRIGFRIILYLLCLNLVSTLVYAINMPGTEYAQMVQVGSVANATEVASALNATTLLDRWTATPFSGIPIFGDIFSGIYLLWNAVSWVIAGFPQLLQSYVYLIPDKTTRDIITSVDYVLIAVSAFVVFAWIVQLITGRGVSE